MIHGFVGQFREPIIFVLRHYVLIYSGKNHFSQYGFDSIFFFFLFLSNPKCCMDAWTNELYSGVAVCRSRSVFGPHHAWPNASFALALVYLPCVLVFIFWRSLSLARSCICCSHYNASALAAHYLALATRLVLRLLTIASVCSAEGIRVLFVMRSCFVWRAVRSGVVYTRFAWCVWFGFELARLPRLLSMYGNVI